jgi:hypothetical protein
MAYRYLHSVLTNGKKMKNAFCLLALLFPVCLFAQPHKELDSYNIVWTSQSKNSGDSMPCGGGDIGLNVWAENGNIYFYLSRTGTFDENNTFLKLGRVKLSFTPNAFAGTDFEQVLHLHEGFVTIDGSNGKLKTHVKLWVEVFKPFVHVEISSNEAVKTEAAYESWRYQDRITTGLENNENSFKWEKKQTVKTLKDNIAFGKNSIEFYHKNLDTSVFDATVREQGLEAVKGELFNPIKGLIFGGKLVGANMHQTGTYQGKYLDTDFEGWKLESDAPNRKQEIEICLNVSKGKPIEEWRKGNDNISKSSGKAVAEQTIKWWNQYWDRSFIFIDPEQKQGDQPQWQAGRNYQLFRYMLGCNAYGSYPTKFNGGLFTYDPSLTNPQFKFTPDFRNWGGGLMTAQNQRLVYWPMLKSGDFNMMQSQFNFYLNCLHNAELRSKVYWGHDGACFAEQIENFGLPNRAEYGFKRPVTFDKGLEYNAWLEYTWDTVLEFCMMMLETERYNNADIKKDIPFIESCLTFFDEHYQYLARQRGSKALDGEGHLVLYPGSGGETYKMAYNPASTIAGLHTVLTRLLELPDTNLNKEERIKWEAMLKRIPPIPTREINGHQTIAPAITWARINNVESMQLYPVFPWGVYGIGKPNLDIALNTWKYDTLTIKFRSAIGWKQDNIFAARLGLTKEAADLTVSKLKDSGRRFPAFWGPGFDWAPDHNWGGSGMIGLQEMLMQTDGKKIYLLPAWPKNWDVHFKLHAPYQTTVEATVKDGKITSLKVWPKEREKDVSLPPNPLKGE